MSYAIHLDPAAVTALACAKGVYQTNLIRGVEALSGATLKGAARRWGGRYASSRAALLSRMTAAGVVWGERRQAHGKRVLVIGGAS